MAATQTVAQRPQFCKPDNSTALFSDSSPVIVPAVLRPRRGVVTLFGYGIRVSVDRGHLVVEDGIGSERYKGRFPRVGHGLERLVVIGTDGLVSLAALRWLADQDAAFVMLERDGSVLATTGPVRSSDARLRRAQALAAQTGAALTIARELISRKLAGQERVACDKLHDSATAQIIAGCQLDLAEADTLDGIRSLESKGAAAYWAAWRDLPISFPKNDLPRVPEHWRSFVSRKSPLSGSPRLAANPANAMLNYLYAVLESEARLAAAALGLDPGLGFIHTDTPARDSLACDLMEAVRPQVDAYVLDCILQQPLRREWFFEKRDGNCRLMAPFAVRLTETAPTWARAVAPVAEWVARTLWTGRRRLGSNAAPPTRLTQRHRREARSSEPILPTPPVPRPQTLCRGCGKEIESGRSHCAKCAVTVSAERMPKIARIGRQFNHTPEALAKEAEKQRQHSKARSAWTLSGHPAWLTEEVYEQKVQPLLAPMTNKAVATRLGVSCAFAGRIRKGYRPHPRHWQALAQLVGISSCV